MVKAILFLICFILFFTSNKFLAYRLYNNTLFNKNGHNVNVLFNGTLDSAPVDKGFCDNTSQLSGYYRIKSTSAKINFNKNYFYWFFESRSNPSKDPFIIWLTGGPGCSSMLALLGENGPCTVNKDISLKSNIYSWNTKANIVWIDQPAGVGFSYTENPEGYDTNEQQVGEDLYQFLQAFFKDNKKYNKLPFYIFGESYGGHYVPAIAYRIFQGNKNLAKDDLYISFKGIGIGNGLTSPQIQYKYYPEMAYNNTYNIKAVDEKTYNDMKLSIPICTKMIQTCQSVKYACILAELYCNAKLISPYQLSGLNVYDIRETCHHFPMCYDFNDITKFLRLPSTLQKLHVDTHHSAKWKECNLVVHTAFSFDWMKNFDQLVSPMLNEGNINVLIYAGDADFIVNWMGCKAWTVELEWNHKEEFQNTKDEEWIPEGSKESMGKIRNTKGLTFLQVYNAGHMVPMNQPKNSLYMLDHFIGLTKARNIIPDLNDELVIEVGPSFGKGVDGINKNENNEYQNEQNMNVINDLMSAF